MSLSKDDFRKIWDEAKANTERLNSCDRHHFDIDLRPERQLGKHWRCRRCSGEVDAIAKYWYELGLKHFGIRSVPER